MLLSLASVDHLVESLVQRLKGLNEANTMIWYLSDNGFLWHEHQLIDKRFPYNESVEVPMLLRWPRHLEPGTVDRDVVGIIDVAPTIYGITGIQPDHNLDGRSVLSSHRTHILTEYWRSPQVPIPTWRAIWGPDRMYVEYPESGETEYYSSADPWQLDNAAADGSTPPGAQDLVDALNAAHDCSGITCP